MKQSTMLSSSVPPSNSRARAITTRQRFHSVLFLQLLAVCLSPASSLLFQSNRKCSIASIMTQKSPFTSTSAVSSSVSSYTLTDWQELNPESLVAAPCLIEQTLCQENDDDSFRFAKDVDYAKAILEAWKVEEASAELVWETNWCHCTYHTTNDHDNDDPSSSSMPLHGHLIQQKPLDSSESNDQNPGIILFHTGAGPHDLFLLYKAASLVNTLSPSCTVLIADILSDESGWAWSEDRTRYNRARTHVLEQQSSSSATTTTTIRPLLRQRVQAAVETLCNIPGVDSQKIAALGYCFGGHPIMELARLEHPSIRAMATFHGVFDGLGSTSEKVPSSNDDDTNTSSNPPPHAEVLICNGVDDPFVSDASLEQALELLQNYGYRTSLLQLASARHGFTNPAQDFNDNPSFAFHAESAAKAWKHTLNMLRRALYNE